MTTLPHEPTHAVHEGPRWLLQLLAPEMWASLTIIVIWLSVLFAAIYGPNIESTTVGGTTSSVPCAIVVALFAFLATWVVAKHGFRHDRTD